MGKAGLVMLAALLLGMAGCVTSETAPAPVGAAEGEAAAIAASAGAARREGARLVVTVGRGTMEFTDYRGKPQGGMYWDAVSHLYRGQLGGGRYHLVERTAYGRTHGVLVDTASGASWSLPATALVAPDGDRLLTLPDESGNKRLQVWLLTGPRPKVELDAQPSLPVRFDGWRGGDRIALRVPDEGVMKTVFLERFWSAWELPAALR